MILKDSIVFGLVSLLLVSCAGEAVKSQADESSGAVTTRITTQPTQLESTDQPLISENSIILQSGSFISGEHSTQGAARIVTQDGKYFLELDQEFSTSNLGPDLVVILHRSSNVLDSTQPPDYPLKEGDYLFLAPLQKFDGAQRYSIPSNVNLADYKSAVVWCRKFNATFGAATLITQ